MNIYLVCYMAVVWNTSEVTPGVTMREDVAVQQCDVMVADKMTGDTLDSMLTELAEKYNVDETPVVSVSVGTKFGWKKLSSKLWKLP